MERKIQMKKIVWMEVHDEAVIKLEEAVRPEDFEVVRPVSVKDKTEHLHLVRDAEYIIAGSIPISEEYMESAPKLKMIQKWGIGVDKIDLKAAKARGISVAITAGANAVPVAELAVGLMLSVNRRIPYADRAMRDGRWVKKELRAECYMLTDKTVCLLGIGSIARRVAEMLTGFHCRIFYYDIRRLPKAQEEQLGVRYLPLQELLSVADILSVHVPLTESTRGMIGETELAAMKSESILINTSRGGVVREEDLCRALSSGMIRGAGLDTYEVEPLPQDSPLRQLENCVLMSHNGGGVIDNVRNVTLHAFENIRKHSLGIPLNAADCILL